MPVADIVRLGLAKGLTNQNLADMALSEWQAARRANKVGNYRAQMQHDREAMALLDLLK